MRSNENPEIFEWFERPIVSIECPDPAFIELLTYSDTKNLRILREVDLYGPFDEIYIDINGSKQAFGEFGFQADMLLDRNPSDGVVGEEELKLLAIFEAFVGGKDGIAIESIPNAYVIRDDYENSFVVSLDRSLQHLYLSSSGSYPTAAPQLDELTLLKHGIHPAESSFDTYCQMLEQLLSHFCASFGFSDEVSLTIDTSHVRPLEPPKQLSAEVEIHQPYPRLDDICGLPQQIEQLRDFLDGIRNPDIMSAWNIEPRQGVLLYGPARTGKTTIVEAIANELDAELIRLNASHIYNMWLGNSERAIKKVFEDAIHAKGYVVLYFNEIDGIINSKSGSSTDMRVSAIFKAYAERLSTENPKAVLVADTNHIDKIDEALLASGRFDIPLYINIPDERGRKELFEKKIFNLQYTNDLRTIFSMVSLDYNRLAQQTEGMNGGDIINILKGLIAGRALQEMRTKTQPPPITQHDLEQAIESFRTR